ncbi:uncharacterized protein [Oscarella lobularis]|uniref:uncharacterized protein n=1 Tax=Oscarella lobularis TaxID=121494 RepID=UPI00331359BA
MHSLVYPLVLWSAVFCGIRGETTNSDQWQTTFGKFSPWNLNQPQAKFLYTNLYDNTLPRHTSTYKRNATSSQAKTRLLFVDLHGVSWSYCPRTASWTRLPGDERSLKHFDQLYGNSFTSLCETRIIAFAGTRVREWGGSYEAWLFNGPNEEWTHLTFTTEVPPARLGHKAFAHSGNDSTCQCKESLFIYGGTSPETRDLLQDFWKLQCVDDRNEQNMKYRWVKINTNLGPLVRYPSNHLLPFSVNNTHIYWLTLSNQSVWIFDVITKAWSSADIEFSCPSYKAILQFEKLETGPESEETVYLKENKLLLFKISSTGLGLFDVNQNQFQCISLFESSDFNSIYMYLTVIKNKLLFLKFQDSIIRALEINLKDFLQVFKKTNESQSRHEIRSTAFVDRSPLLMWNARLVSISDNLWYLMQENQKKLEMWRFELDSLMWTLYDPDQMPGINQGMIDITENPICRIPIYSIIGPPKKCYRAASFEAAYSVTKTKDVAFFGSSHGFHEKGRDDLWIYRVKRRQWTRVVPDGFAPQKLSSYATMASMSNGSLLLFGGIDGRNSSLWMATINYERKNATWKRLCCDGSKQMPQPTNRLQQWSSAFWNNSLFVYFGHKINEWNLLRMGDTLYQLFAPTDLSCNWNMYHTNIGSGNLTWQIKEMPPRNTCGWSSQAYGRFAFTEDNYYYLVADLSKATWKDKIVRPLPERLRNLIVASDNKLFTVGTTTLQSGNRSAIISIRSIELEKCKPGMYSPQYSFYECRSCPKGQYSDKYGAVNCTYCPNGFVTTSTGSISIKNCTCAPKSCVHGTCIVQTDYTTICVCNAGFTGKGCETPTMYLIGIGTVVGLLLVFMFYYCLKRVKRHKKVAQYTRIELEMAEQTVEQLSSIWSVNSDEVKFERVIGQGAFGDVWTAQYRDQTVAVKILKIKAEDCTDEQLEEFKDESDLLRSIFHANIVRFIGTGKTDENKPFIVLEYMERGSVRNELDSKYAHQQMEVSLKVRYALDAAKGMRHLHKINRMHRDLKCDNLLINDKGTVKVADLGCTKIAPKISDDDDSEARGSRAVGTALFRAPEIIRGEAYNIAVDVYSYGITLWEIMTAKYPYVEKFEQKLTVTDILDLVVNTGVRPEIPVHCTEDLTKLAISCWNENPLERPTFEKIVPTLEGIWLSQVKNDK